MSWFFKPPIQGPDGRVPGGTFQYDGGAGTNGNLTDDYAYPPSFGEFRVRALFAPRTAPADFGTAGNPGTVAPNSYPLSRTYQERYGATHITRAGYGYYRNGLVAATPGTTIPWSVGAGGLAGSIPERIIPYSTGSGPVVIPESRITTAGENGAIKIDVIPVSSLRVTGARHTDPPEEITLVAEVTDPRDAQEWIVGYEYNWTISDERLGSLSSKTARNPVWSCLLYTSDAADE